LERRLIFYWSLLLMPLFAFRLQEKNMMCALKAVIFMEPSLQKIYSSGRSICEIKR
jgi:hypothetical protein